MLTNLLLNNCQKQLILIRRQEQKLEGIVG